MTYRELVKWVERKRAEYLKTQHPLSSELRYYSALLEKLRKRVRVQMTVRRPRRKSKKNTEGWMTVRRKGNRLSQETVAEKLGTTAMSVSRWERSVRTVPTKVREFYESLPRVDEEDAPW